MAFGIGEWSRRKALSARKPRRQLAGVCRIEALEERQLLTLLIQIRDTDGNSSLKVTSSTGQINLEVWATVTGSDSNTKNEGLSFLMGSFKSTNVGGGSALANLFAEPLAPFDATTSTGGTQVDLDGDGDLDVGSNDDTTAAGFFLGRASPAQYLRSTTRVATLTASVSQLLAGVQTDITFVPRYGPSGEGCLWIEDGNAKNYKNGTIEVSPFRLTRTDAAAPTATLNTLAAVTEGASTYDFSVTYNDDLGVSRATIGDGDVIVTDPSGQTLSAVLLSANNTSNAKQIIATYRINAPGGAWDGTKNGTYTISVAADQVADDAGKKVAAGTLGTFEVAFAVPEGVPTAALTASTTAVGGAKSVDLTVTYTDDNAISLATLGDGDLVVAGPDGKTLTAKFVSADQNTNAATITATYRVNAPGGMWDATRNGLYTVTTATGQVTDAAGFSVATTGLGTFTVKVANAVLSSSGILRVIGRNKNDTILLSAKSKTTYVTLNGKQTKFSTSKIKTIQVYGLAGNDVITIGSGVIGCTLDGGVGKDTITGGNGNDTIYARDGSVDVINGGKGNNRAKVDKSDRAQNIQVFLK